MSPGLRDRVWRRFLRGPDPALLEELYVPALKDAVRYDRCCAYFSSTVLSAAARGFGGLIERLVELGDAAPRPAVRLVVNEELAEDDIRVLMEQADVAPLEEALRKRFRKPKDVLEKDRLSMLGWLVAKGFLDVRVGVMRRGGGIVHAKFGLAMDEAGDALVFAGSGNESAQGLAGNYERLEVSTSWGDAERFEEYRKEFDALWADEHADVHTLPLPEALRLQLVKLAPKEPPIVEPSDAAARQRAAMLWQLVVEAPYFEAGGATCEATAPVEMWPHQRHVVEESATAWPDGRLLCDEVGMGKTIEAILVLRRLLAGRGVRRALLLLPAGLLRQWQGELREKGGLLVPRLDGLTNLVFPDEKTQKVMGLAEALRQDLLLMSRETARTEANRQLLLDADPWDLVLLDESHAARRRKQEEGEFNSGTLLLDLLRALQLGGRTKSILLLSATPMQTHPWEPWDLLQVLGEGGAWLSEFGRVRDYYEAVAAVRAGRRDPELARRAARMVKGDGQFPTSPMGLSVAGTEDALARTLQFHKPSEREALAAWLRRGSPLTRRMHRNTRETLRAYHRLGLLEAPPPTRVVKDVYFEFGDFAERSAYDAVGQYIERRFHELEEEKPGKGFVMTIYRRRAASSPRAILKSLERRAEGLKRVEARAAIDPWLTGGDEIDPRDLDDLGDGDLGGTVSSAYPQDPAVARRERLDVEKLLDEVRALGLKDSKRDRFFEALHQLREDGRAVLIFTEYSDTMEYLQDLLLTHYGDEVACYSGSGGQVREGGDWKSVTKAQITKLLRDGKIRLLVCTDAASEGLNLQAAAALVNYDLPWNPSKVEQRIGRIDRIGQKSADVKVVNLLLGHSIDEQVYRVLRTRCRVFETFVGAMQPVLGRARRMLLGQEPLDLAALEAAAASAQADPLAAETYLESLAEATAAVPAAINREELRSVLLALPVGVGIAVKTKGETCEVRAAKSAAVRFALTPTALEQDPRSRPLTPFEPVVRDLATSLTRPGERLPFVVGSFERGGFRASVAYWVGNGKSESVSSLKELKERLEGWTGSLPESAAWISAQKTAQGEARSRVETMEAMAAEKVEKARVRQLAAARERLHRELGRYLVCFDHGTADLNGLLGERLARDIESARWLKLTVARLGGYPEWPEGLRHELELFRNDIKETQRKARLTGREVVAALEDPRWAVADAPLPAAMSGRLLLEKDTTERFAPAAITIETESGQSIKRVGEDQP